MSALAGIFKFDLRDRVGKSELVELAHSIDRIGPDGGNETLNGNVGMAYRAFHTTPESHLERQPRVRDGCIGTWDGRLDNRDEIVAGLQLRVEDTPPTDLDLVFAAYKQWGTASFAELLGDWAIVLWDQSKQQLILGRDYMGVRRLFYRIDDDSVTWCTAPEPLVMTAKQKLHLDMDFLAACFYPRPPIESTAYQEIRSVVPATFITFRPGGKQQTVRYWSLNPNACIRYSSDEDYEVHFLRILRDAVHKRLRSDRTVTAELSGGVDSSSIVCMADRIRRDEPCQSVETLSYYDTDEPSGDERPYFSIIERLRGRTGNHVSLSDFSIQTRGMALRPLPDNHFVATPGYFAKYLEWQSLIRGILDRTGSRVVLSGLGGDELLGGVQYEAAELADHLVAGRVIPFCRSLMAWGLARKKTVYSLLFDVFQLVRARYAPATMLNGPLMSLPWVHLKPGKHPSHPRFTDWARLSPSKLSLESVRYSIATQLSCTDLPLVGCAEPRYPYLDRNLYTFIAAIPRQQVLQPTHRRYLMRRALREIVPEEVLFRKTKWFGSRSVQVSLLDDREIMREMFDEPWLAAEQIIDVAAVRRHFNAVEHGVAQDGLPLRSAIGLELWLRSQTRLNRIAFPGDGAPTCRTTPRTSSSTTEVANSPKINRLQSWPDPGSNEQGSVCKSTKGETM
jgi:asparagine synthase (glutamine-hydrolysing)